MSHPTVHVAHPLPFPAPQARRPYRAAWFVGLAVAAVIGLVIGAGAALFGGVVHLVKSSDAYRTSLQFVRNSPRVVETLGEPVEDGVVPTGSVKVSGSFGDARLSIRLHGPRGDGWAHVVSHKDGIKWAVDDAKLESARGVIELTH